MHTKRTIYSRCEYAMHHFWSGVSGRGTDDGAGWLSASSTFLTSGLESSRLTLSLMSEPLSISDPSAASRSFSSLVSLPRL